MLRAPQGVFVIQSLFQFCNACVMGYGVSSWTLSFKLLSTRNFGDHFVADDTLRKTDSI